MLEATVSLRRPTAIPSRPIGAWVAAFAAFGAVWTLFTALFLYEFYVKGSFLLDAGWFAFVMSSGQMRLPDPTPLGGHSFFATHTSPLFILTGLIRCALDVSPVRFFCGVMAFGHALPVLAVFWAWRAIGFRTGSWHYAVLLGAGFALNGLAIAIARFPHFEILEAAAIMLFATALVQHRLAIAAVFLIAALATREDAGCHIFGLLAVLVALNRWRGIPLREQRAEILFAVFSLLSSAAAVAAQQHFAVGPSALTRIYLGDPLFTGLTWYTVVVRLIGCFAFRAYLVLPALVVALWAVRTRNAYLLVGYAAFLPWGLLQLVAQSEVAGTLSGYYAFPFLIAMFWPLLGLRLAADPAAALRPVASAAWFAAVIAASMVDIAAQANPGHYPVAGFLRPPSWSQERATDQAIEGLRQEKAQLGAVLVTDSVAALAPDAFAPQETFFGRGADEPDAIAYMAEARDSEDARRLAAATGLTLLYQVPGTELRIALRRPLDAMSAIGALPAPEAER